MHVRDRIKELRRVPAKELLPNPKNWRLHPERQQNAMRALLAEIGYAGALIARETEGGRLQLIDGHLRAETTPDQWVPVLILDVTAAEADKILATHDAVTGLAESDEEAFRSLINGCDFESSEIKQLLSFSGDTHSHSAPSSENQFIPSAYQVIVTCHDEDDQRALYEQLTETGRQCRLLVI